MAARTAAARKKMIQKKFKAVLILGRGFKKSVRKTITTAKVAMKTQAILTFRRCFGRPASSSASVSSVETQILGTPSLLFTRPTPRTLPTGSAERRLRPPTCCHAVRQKTATAKRRHQTKHGSAHFEYLYHLKSASIASRSSNVSIESRIGVLVGPRMEASSNKGGLFR